MTVDRTRPRRTSVTLSRCEAIETSVPRYPGVALRSKRARDASAFSLTSETLENEDAKTCSNSTLRASVAWLIIMCGILRSSSNHQTIKSH
jgi:hypothetical protein